MPKNLRAAFFLAAFMLHPAWVLCAAAALPVAADRVSEPFSLRHSAHFVVDAGGGLDITEVSSPLRQRSFRSLEGGLPLEGEGALWLRFSLIRDIPGGEERMPARPAGALLLDLGRDAPPARLYLAESLDAGGEARQWRDFIPGAGGIFRLPEPELLPLTVYVRLESLPGLWFDPRLRREGAQAPFPQWAEGELLLLSALGLALLALFIRGAAGREEWRLWGAAVLACALAQAMYSDNGAGVSLIHPALIPRLLAPGLALILMPHLGRYFLRPPAEEEPEPPAWGEAPRPLKAMDKLLIALSLPGVFTALLPLLPGLGWSARLLPLAPLILVLPLAVTLPALRGAGPRGAAYLLLLALPLAASMLALRLAYEPDLLPWRELGPQLNTLGYLAAGLLMLALPSTTREKKDFFPLDAYLPAEDEEKNKPAPEKKNTILEEENTAPGERISVPGEGTPRGEPLEVPSPNPVDAVAIRKAAALPPNGYRSLLNPSEGKDTAAARVPTDNAPLSPLDALAEMTLPLSQEIPGQNEEEEDRETVLELDLSLRLPPAETPAPPTGALPADLPARERLAAAPGEGQGQDGGAWADTPIASPPPPPRGSLKGDPGADAGFIGIEDEEEPGLIILKPSGAPAPAPAGAFYAPPFNLAGLIRRVHGELLPLAGEKGLELSWFVAPNLPVFYRAAPAGSGGMSGTEKEEDIFSLILDLARGGLMAAESGRAGLSVREARGEQAEDKPRFSLLEFSLHLQRSRPASTWPAQALELAERAGLRFNLDFSPEQGLSFSFILELSPLPEAEPTAAQPGHAAQARPSDPYPALLAVAPGGGQGQDSARVNVPISGPSDPPNGFPKGPAP
ncbi:MAG: hypothetical protein LBD82_01510, partial [Deltaproteobacteria bacterium]|nr:hypothetical protein [Deltaproteobacteria bacterium]